MSLFDQNQWYQISIRSFASLSMAGRKPGPDSDAGAVFFQNTNTSLFSQRWQLFLSEKSTYILRSAASQGSAYLAVRANTTSESETGGTTAIMRTAETAGEEAFWKIQPFNNGYFSMKNMANGTNWSLFAKDAGLMAMTSNIAGQQENQSFNFTRVGAIDDQKFSTIQTPTSTSNPKNPSDQASSSSGLPTSTAVAIGVSISGAALLCLVVGLLFLLRRRRNIKQTIVTSDIPDTNNINSCYPVKDAYHDSDMAQYHQQYTLRSPQELDTTHTIAEMEGERHMQVNQMEAAREMSPVELATDVHMRR